MKKAKILCATALSLSLLSGCGKFEPDATAMMASKDGTLTAVVMETLDQSYYDSAELQTLITTEVADYNASVGTEKIKVTEFKAENQTANLTMEYTTGSDYAAFNDVTCYTGDILGAYSAGYDFDVVFHQIEKGEVINTSVSRSEVLNSYNYYILILEEPMDIQVEGKLVYVSSNVEVTGKNTCRVVSSVSEAETEQETMEDGTVVLSPDSVTTADGEESQLAYIIYE